MEQVSCNADIPCRYRELGQCREDIHHKYWPSSNFRTRIEKQFRQLPENKEITCRERHDQIHATESEPIKPSRDAMLRAIAESAIGGSHEQAA